MRTYADVDYVNWDLSPFFNGTQTQEYDEFFSKLNSETRKLQQLVSGLGKLDVANIKNWSRLFLKLEDVLADLHHVNGYLKCLVASDNRRAEARAELSRADKMGVEHAKILSFVKWNLKSATEQNIKLLVAETELTSAEPYIRRLIREARYSLPPDQEQLMADMEMHGLIAWGRLYEQLVADLTLELNKPNGDRDTVPFSLLRTLLSDTDAAIREVANEAARQVCSSVAPEVAACLNNIIGCRLTSYRYRDCDDVLDKACLDAGLSRHVVDNMFDAIRRNRDISQRYLQLKANVLKRSRIRYEDLRAPLVENTARFSLNQARTILEESFASTYPGLAGHIQQVFEDRWIDTMPDEHKMPGGFCVGSAKIRESRIMMTYAGSQSDLCILAHELGHSYHWHVAHQQRYFLQQIPLPFSEAIAMFSEGLMRWSMMESSDFTNDVKLPYLVADLNTAATFLLEIPAHYEFEVAAYKARATGELTASSLNSLMRTAQDRWLGDIFDTDSLNESAWVGVPHHYVTYTSFYNFPYCFGYLLAEIMLARFEEQGSLFIDCLEKALVSSGAMSIEELAGEILKIDLSNGDVWEMVFSRIGQRVQRLQDMLAERS